MKKTKKQNRMFNRVIITIAVLLILMCLFFIGVILKAANDQSFLVVFVLAFAIAIVIIFFTAKDMLK